MLLIDKFVELFFWDLFCYRPAFLPIAHNLLRRSSDLSFRARRKDMKEQIMKFAHIQYQNILSDATLLPQQQLYQLSMPLLALATLKDNDGYGHILADMEFVLNDDQRKSQIQKPWQLWMGGRMAMAAKLAGDTLKLEAIKETLSSQLFEYDSKDVITGWAVAYLAAIDKHSYEKCRKRLFLHAEFVGNSYKENPANEASNFVWTLVMSLYAAASTANRNDYCFFQQKLKNLTKSNSLKETAQLVPDEDYRQWLISIARYSFQMMKDEASLAEIKNTNKSEVNSLDSMLALANEYYLMA